MAKREKAGELDGSLIIQSFKDTGLLDNPSNVIVEKTESDAPVEEPEKDVPVTEETTGDTPKNKSRRRKGNYDEVFLKRKELKTRQPVYISQHIHERIIKLVHLLALADKDISVGGYIDNVLEEHLEQHKDEIADLYRRQIDDLMNSNK